VALQQTDPGLVTQSTGDIIAFYNAVSGLCFVLYALYTRLCSIALHGVCPSAAFHRDVGYKLVSAAAPYLELHVCSHSCLRCQLPCAVIPVIAAVVQVFVPVMKGFLLSLDHMQ
jgi:hypothetical protein